MISVEKAIEEMDMEKLRGIVGGNLPFDPYPYQWATTNETTKEIRDYQHPFIVKAAVSAGKTVMISMICRRLWAMQTEALVLSRSGEIVEQDNEEMRNFSIYSPIFCASLKSKSTGNGSPRKQIISGSEGTVVNGLTKELKDFTPRFLLIDECLTGDTMIETATGSLRIDNPELVNREIICMDESSKRIKKEKPVRVFSNGIKRVSSIKHSSGELKCTDTHRIYSEGCWIRAQDLKVGMTIHVRDTQSSLMKRLLRASAAVVKKLISTPLDSGSN